MKFRTISLLLILPLFLYLGYRMVTSFQGWDAITIPVFVGLLVVNAVQMVPWKGRYVTLSGLWVMVVMFVFGGLAIGLTGGIGIDISAAILLASPFLVETWIWQAEDSPGKRIVALQFAFLDGIMIVAALHSLSSSGLAISSGNLVYAYGNVDITQARGLYGLLTGGPVGSLPLQSAMDPALIVLGGLALLGVFAPILHPETGTGISLPIEAEVEMAPLVAYSPELEMAREETKALFRWRSQSRPPPFSQLPGMAALFTSGAITLAFVYASLQWPSETLLPAFLVLAAVLVVVLIAARRSVGAPRLLQSPAPQPDPYSRAPVPLPGAPVPGAQST